MATDPNKPAEQPAELTQEQKIARALATFTYTGSNLSDPTWMAKWGDDYARAVRNGKAVKVGD